VRAERWWMRETLGFGGVNVRCDGVGWFGIAGFLEHLRGVFLTLMSK
jgi:hypothetical protein